ncbi:13 kDa ribonucleoprotein-associated protein [Colletotrichum tanaceti]|uniref:13 kDa ribonucleoprotein-associated protein n=1 Tax=Colletotrichum tanaceti TaxID=1306861 RepID=A0A4U6XR91_9PEZI|nr:13 kDa ribonucleoprotein-associated protein [Colletotrichum tanaceti]TKW58395.1 13 kDa ribonucleoprotein-associated protein [Colletotrichum tanaceti]
MSDTLVAQIPQSFHHESQEVPGQSYPEPKPAALSDDLGNELYELLLLAFDQDQAVEGTTKVYEAVSNGEAELVVCAADVVRDFALDHVPALCESHGVLHVFVPSRYVLGQRCGFDYSISAATITSHEDSDLAAAINELKEKLQENQSRM